MNIITGDLVQLANAGEYDVILHACNCMNQMGRGIAQTIKNTWPAAYEVDCQTTKADINKLGTITWATVTTLANTELTVVNCYTQYRYHDPGKVLTELWAVRRCMDQVKDLCKGKRIAYPPLGCGLGKGDWNQVGPIIQEALKGEDQTLVLHRPA